MKTQMKELVDRFLTWPLPQSVASDGCATDPTFPHPRSGTNLLTADEAEAMLVYVLGLEDELSLERLAQKGA